MIKAIPIIYRNAVYIYASKDRQPLRVPTGVKAAELNHKGLLNKTLDEDYEEKNVKILEKLDLVQQSLKEHPEWTMVEMAHFLRTGEDPQMKGKRVMSFIEVCRLFNSLSESGDRKTSRGLRISQGTLNNYEIVYSKILRFAKDTKYNLSDWENINHTFYTKYCEWCWHTLENTDSTVGRDIIYMKTVLKWGMETEHIRHNVDLRNWKNISEEQNDIFILYFDEIKLLHRMSIRIGDDSELRKEIPAKYIAHNERRMTQIRDCFLVGVFTCFRISELMSLTEDDLVITGNEWYIYRVVKKTKRPIKIRLNSIAVDIIQQYRHQHKTLLPHFSEMTFNNNLKRLGVLFKEYVSKAKEKNPDLVVNDWTTFKRIRTRNGVHYTEFVEPKDILSSHCMRRSGISNLLMMGMSEWEVREISQHKSEAFYKYVKIAQQLTSSKHTNIWESVLS